MARAALRFYEELNDFLPPERRKREFEVRFREPCPVRHLIERCGVPHTEVEIILLDGRSVDIEAPVPDGARISVYPMFESLDVTPLLKLRPRPLRHPRFVADAHLGGLARHLRLLGFDTRYGNDPGDAELARIAAEEGRILLSRDRGLLMRRRLTHGCYVRAQRPLRQLQYVMDRCDLYRLAAPFTRCMECNGLLIEAQKAAVCGRVPDDVAERFDAFWQCEGCGRVYWRGSHYRRLCERVDGILACAPQPA